jgi:hypothetical protein
LPLKPSQKHLPAHAAQIKFVTDWGKFVPKNHCRYFLSSAFGSKIETVILSAHSFTFL